MGYYASGTGWAKIKDECSYEEVDAKLKEVGDKYNFWFETCPSPGGKHPLLDIEFEYSRYDDWFEDALNMIADIVCAGEVTFTGEDSDHWRFKFVDGTWIEQAGTIVYGMKYPDEQMAAAVSLKNWVIGMYLNKMSDAEMNKETYKRMIELGLFGE